MVVDVDGTRQAARQRALPQLESLPSPHRRFDQVCTPGYQGRKRGEVVRTRTVLLQAHTHQFLGTFGGPGNGDYRGELLRAIAVITSYATKLTLPTASVLLRLDGLYGDAAPLLDVLTTGLGVIASRVVTTVSSRRHAFPTPSCSGVVERLASLSYPTSMAEDHAE